MTGEAPILCRSPLWQGVGGPTPQPLKSPGHRPWGCPVLPGLSMADMRHRQWLCICATPHHLLALTAIRHHPMRQCLYLGADIKRALATLQGGEQGAGDASV